VFKALTVGRVVPLLYCVGDEHRIMKSRMIKWVEDVALGEQNGNASRFLAVK
jgi:hypothetical protein